MCSGFQHPATFWPQGSLETDLGLGTITHPIHMTSMDPECNSQFVEFQKSITAPRPAGCSRTLLLAGHGLEPNREGVLVSQLAIYIERDVASHLQAWKGKPAQELAQDHGFFQAIIKAPVEKLVHANLLRGPAKGPHYGNLLVGAIRKRLTKQGTLGQAEEQTLEKIFHFFQPITHLGTSLLYAYPSPSHVTVTVEADGAEASLTVSSEALVSAMLDTVLGVETLSPSTTAATVRGINVWIN